MEGMEQYAAAPQATGGYPPGADPKQKAVVTAAYEALCVEVDELAKRAAMLEERISWVLSPAEAEGAALEAWPTTGIELADRITGVQKNVQMVSRRIANVHARVEL